MFMASAEDEQGARSTPCNSTKNSPNDEDLQYDAGLSRLANTLGGPSPACSEGGSSQAGSASLASASETSDYDGAPAGKSRSMRRHDKATNEMQRKLRSAVVPQKNTAATDGAAAATLNQTEEEHVTDSPSEEELAEVELVRHIDQESIASEVAQVQSMWEMASILEFLEVFHVSLNLGVEYTSSSLEDALVTSPGKGLLEELHLALLKGISSQPKSLDGSNWARALAHRLATANRYCINAAAYTLWTPLRGEEAQAYAELPAPTRVRLLKGLCELRAEREDLRFLVDDTLAAAAAATAAAEKAGGGRGRHASGQQAPVAGALSAERLRKVPLGEDASGARFWYFDLWRSARGFRLYRESKEAAAQAARQAGEVAAPARPKAGRRSAVAARATGSKGGQRGKDDGRSAGSGRDDGAAQQSKQKLLSGRRGAARNSALPPKAPAPLGLRLTRASVAAGIMVDDTVLPERKSRRVRGLPNPAAKEESDSSQAASPAAGGHVTEEGLGTEDLAGAVEQGVPAAAAGWEVVAETEEALMQVGQAFSTSRNLAEAELGARILEVVLPPIAARRQREERRQRQARSLTDSLTRHYVSSLYGRSLRERRPTSYKLDTYDRAIHAAIRANERGPQPRRGAAVHGSDWEDMAGLDIPAEAEGHGRPHDVAAAAQLRRPASLADMRAGSGYDTEGGAAGEEGWEARTDGRDVTPQRTKRRAATRAVNYAELHRGSDPQHGPRPEEWEGAASLTRHAKRRTSAPLHYAGRTPEPLEHFVMHGPGHGDEPGGSGASSGRSQGHMEHMHVDYDDLDGGSTSYLLPWGAHAKRQCVRHPTQYRGGPRRAPWESGVELLRSVRAAQAGPGAAGQKPSPRYQRGPRVHGREGDIGSGSDNSFDGVGGNSWEGVGSRGGGGPTAEPAGSGPAVVGGRSKHRSFAVGDVWGGVTVGRAQKDAQRPGKACVEPGIGVHAVRDTSWTQQQSVSYDGGECGFSSTDERQRSRHRGLLATGRGEAGANLQRQTIGSVGDYSGGIGDDGRGHFADEQGWHGLFAGAHVGGVEGEVPGQHSNAAANVAASTRVGNAAWVGARSPGAAAAARHAAVPAGNALESNSGGRSNAALQAGQSGIQKHWSTPNVVPQRRIIGVATRPEHPFVLDELLQAAGANSLSAETDFISSIVAPLALGAAEVRDSPTGATASSSKQSAQNMQNLSPKALGHFEAAGIVPYYVAEVASRKLPDTNRGVAGEGQHAMSNGNEPFIALATTIREERT